MVEPNPAAAAPQPGPPMGASPVSAPSPNRGYEAAAAQRLGLVIKQLTDLLPLAGATSEIGKDILKALSTLGKHVPSGSVSPAAEKSNIERMSMQNTQQNAQMQALKQQGAGAAQGAPPAAAAQRAA